ncbi:DUF429 domain-containing protein [Brevibacterium sp. CS2]|uniref:DUF429 domain-containing protein n=1 Tax=Brevibacterium sp. CS2 TaxID=2575923 RepID=UPI0010C7A7AF|nr:DUF429 domain-containing protein [Brevibacterium sp. CS2]QCP06528.1 DUF429 domain-containing protein [Brevibacterium sp. CS2]
MRQDGSAGGVWCGIDLAADPRRTGLAFLTEDPSDHRVRVESVTVGADDEAIIAAVLRAARAGVDVPFGWPQPFVELVGAHARGGEWPARPTGDGWRRRLAMRTTDLLVHERTGLVPLSVSADRIAHPAFRWAAIAARLGQSGADTARDGTGRACEVYPAAALKRWGLPHRGYKRTDGGERRRALVQQLAATLPWLDWQGSEALCADSDDALDAVVAALLAREIDRGRFVRPEPEQDEAARAEGWICLPTDLPTPPAHFASA